MLHRSDSREDSPVIGIDRIQPEHSEDPLWDDPQFFDDIFRSWTDSVAGQVPVEDVSQRIECVEHDEEPIDPPPPVFFCPSMEECIQGAQNAWKRDMKFLLESGIGSDISVVVSGEQKGNTCTLVFHLHRVFLSASTEFFREKLPTYSDKQIELCGLWPHAFHSIVKYIYYTDRDESHQISSVEFWPLFSATKNLGIDKLRNELIQNTLKYLSFHNVMETIQHALLHGIDEITDICLSFLSKKFSLIGKLRFENVESELLLHVVNLLLERRENGFDEWCAVAVLLIFMVSQIDLRSMTAVEFGECVQNIVDHVRNMDHACSTTIVRISFRCDYHLGILSFHTADANPQIISAVIALDHLIKVVFPRMIPSFMSSPAMQTLLCAHH